MSGKVSSMTGFARTSGEADWGAWAWEAKSVNGRSMDVRVNVPSGFEALDRHIKQQASKVFSRGNLQVGLRIELAGGSDALSVNQDALKSLVRAYEVAAQGHAPDSAALATLMTVKGVIETGSASTRDIADEAAIQVLMAAGTAVLEELSVARQAEGAALLELMSGHLSDMEAHVASATELAAEQPKLLKARLEKQLTELEATEKVDAERMAAEIALSAAKADVREELDRLTAHIATGRLLLAEGGAIGRKLDFLSQEFNREANTLCSKSVSMDLTNAGLALKGLIDQFKEQAANVE
ncbi:YicC/YloC family endoribonuclease [Henriciella litoralis]|uniref:YicC/YloC family endoribonuclease n=1 Tax=Henriciella litoralis TaxID=568102 RepID=UPI0009FF44F1|nr:YicC/YloC family endoribonuclease [Henriciella litoralis]